MIASCSADLPPESPARLVMTCSLARKDSSLPVTVALACRERGPACKSLTIGSAWLAYKRKMRFREGRRVPHRQFLNRAVLRLITDRFPGRHDPAIRYHGLL